MGRHRRSGEKAGSFDSAQDRLFDCAPFSRSAQDDIRWFVASDSGVLVNEWNPLKSGEVR
jgi:hypothetical protein